MKEKKKKKSEKCTSIYMEGIQSQNGSIRRKLHMKKHGRK
jgi:hypothetical protein